VSSRSQLKRRLEAEFTPRCLLWIREARKLKHIKVRWSIRMAASSAVLTFLLLIFPLCFCSVSLYMEHLTAELMMDPVKILAALLRFRPATAVILIAAAAFISAKAVYWYSSLAPDETDEYGNPIDPSSLHGASKMMTRAEKKRWLDISAPDDPKGTILGIDKKTGEILGIPDTDRTYLDQLDNRNLLVMGAPGRGKSNFLRHRVYQSIKNGYSLLFLDPKGEETIDAAPKCMLYRYRHFWSMRFRREDAHLSSGMDLLKIIRQSEHPELIAGWIAELILSNRISNAKDPYWPDSMHGLLTTALLFVSKGKTFVPAGASLSSENHTCSSKDRTWKEVVKILNLPGDDIDALFSFAIESSEDDEALLSGNYWKWKEDPNYKRIASSLTKSLGVMKDPVIADIFSRDEVDLDKAVLEPAFLSIMYETPNTFFKPAMTLFIELYMDSVRVNATRNNGKKIDLRNVVILEELSCAGRIKGLEDYLSIVRSYGTQMILCSQSYPQLVEIYGENLADSFFQNLSVVYTGGHEYMTRMKLEEISGTGSVKEQSGSMTIGPNGTMRGEQDHSKPNPAVSADRLKNLDKGEIFFKLSNCNAAIEKAYNADDHPMSDIHFIDSATGRRRDICLDEIVPGWSPEKMGLTPVWDDRDKAITRKEESELDYLAF